MPRCRRWWALASLLLLAGLTSAAKGPGESDRGAWSDAGPGAGAAGLQRRLGETARRGLREIRRLWPKRSAPKLNVTGTFRGEWTQLAAWPQQFGLGSAPLQHGAGVTVLKLRHVGGGQGGVFGVDGEMVLRDGQYVSSGDLLLSVTGVYVPAAGKLMAVAEPAHPLRLPASLSLYPRWGLGQQGSGSGGESSSSAHGGLGVHAALLEARTRGRWAEGSEEDAAAADHAGRYREQVSWQRCSFVLDLVAAQPPASQAADPVQPLRHKGGHSSHGSSHSSSGGGRREVAASHSDGPAPNGVDAVQSDGYVDDSHSGSWEGQVTAKPGGARPGMMLHGSLTSRDCGIRLALALAPVKVDEYYSKAVNYTLMVTAMGFLQVLLLVRQMESVSTQALAARVSLLTLAHQAILDAYLCLVHLTLGVVVDSLLHSFGTIALMQFVIFSVFEMRLLLTVSRARRGSSDSWTAQRDASLLYARFYAGLLGGILLTYQLQRHFPVLLFGFFSFWLPQIVLCVRGDVRQPLKPEFVLGTSVARLALPLYLYGCPSNLLRVQPNPQLCAALVAWVALQAAVLLVQRAWGPRCFLPRCLLPHRYDYGRPLPPPRCGDAEEGGDCQECIICLSDVDVACKAQRALTPCGHVFHRACLAQWCECKAACPTCRRPLPPL